MKREEKLQLLAEGLLDGARVIMMKKPQIKKVMVSRNHLQDLIRQTLRYTDTHTINNWIRVLIVEGLISEHSKQSYKRPHPLSRYTINMDECELN